MSISNQTQNSTLLSLRDFNSYYGAHHAIKGVSMDIQEKKITAFIGPSGCGKSTLLRWFNRMNDLIPSARATGEISLHGQNMLDPRLDVVAMRKRIGMVFQKPNPFPKSIYDNVAFGPRLHARLSRSATDELVEKSLTRAALWNEVKDRLHASAMGLSGGQQQRLCIARTIASEPEVVLMDEPCSALDPRSTLAVEELMEQLRQDYTIVIVTHNMQQAARASDYTAFLYQGELVEFGETSKIFTTPREKKTEDYIRGKFG